MTQKLKQAACTQPQQMSTLFCESLKILSLDLRLPLIVEPLLLYQIESIVVMQMIYLQIVEFMPSLFLLLYIQFDTL